VAQLVKNPPAMQETQLRSLGWEALEEGMATHSSILAWRIPMDHDQATNTSLFMVALRIQGYSVVKAFTGYGM